MRFVSDTKDSRWPGQSYSEFLSHWKQLYVKPLVVVRNLQTGCMSVHGARGEGDREKLILRNRLMWFWKQEWLKSAEKVGMLEAWQELLLNLESRGSLEEEGLLPLGTPVFSLCCCCSLAQSYLILCDPMDCSTPGFPVHYHLPELAQTHVYWVGDAIQPSHSLSSPSPPAFNLSQHQARYQWVGSSHQVTNILELQSFQWIFRTDFLWDWLFWSPCSPRDSKEPPSIPQLESIDSLVLSLYGPTLTSIHHYWKNHSFDCAHFCRQSNVSAF